MTTYRITSAHGLFTHDETFSTIEDAKTHLRNVGAMFFADANNGRVIYASTKQATANAVQAFWSIVAA